MKSINSDIAYDHIKKRILNGEYRPGMALMTNVLAIETGVSRTPVRDALRQLEADGLVVIQPRLGARVKQMDLKEFREMCELRLALESHAAGLAARQRNDDDLREIGFALESMVQLTEQIIAKPADAPLLKQLVREDVRFHLAIMTVAKNDLMKKEILRLHLINRVVSAPIGGASQGALPEKNEEALRRQVLASHTEIFQAIQAGDSVAAKKAMEAHIQDIIDRNLRSMVRDRPNLVTRELTEDEAAYNA
ncbi:MAG: GntR family transcriptional regulator [Opitutaceae bacterium]